MSSPHGVRSLRRATLPIVLQTEAAECGLACLAMVAGFHGYRIDLPTLRRVSSISLRGATLAHLVSIAGKMGLETRALRVELRALRRLRLPCILHWDFNHFVVLSRVGEDSVVIHDPASGQRTVPLAELSARFTGVVLELWPGVEVHFEHVEPQRAALRDLMGKVRGLVPSLLQVLIVALALEAAVVVSPFFLQWVLDEALVSADRHLLTQLAIAFGVLLLFQAALSSGRSWMLMYLSTILNVQWQANVFKQLLRLPMSYFQKRHLGDVSSRFGATEQIQGALTTSSIVAVLDGVLSIVLLLMMYAYSPALTAIVVLGTALYTVGRLLSYHALKGAMASQVVFESAQYSHFLESVRGIKTIKLFQREEMRKATWLRLLIRQINATVRVQKFQIGYGLANALLAGLQNVATLWLGGRMILDGQLSVGMLIAFKAYQLQFDGRVSDLIEKAFQFRLLRIQRERLADIVLTEPEPAAPPDALPANAAVSGSIELSALCFRYAEHEPLVLNGVSLRIEDGESVAIMGPSGCGKTTLMHVMLGILEPVSGDTKIGGLSVRQLGPRAVRGLTSTVCQDDVLLSGTIGENISFFDPAADAAWIKECARMAAIHDDISAMSMGYASPLGDSGIGLSGGQIQRVLLARALYRRPKILFLDEASSHLDLERERQVNAAIRELNMTRVVIAHRPATIASADRLLMMVSGRIVTDIQMRAAGAPRIRVA